MFLAPLVLTLRVWDIALFIYVFNDVFSAKP